MARTRLKGVIFDLDGVITATANVHALAWESMFNDFLQRFSERENMPFRPFDRIDDYHQFVDGMPRYEGVMSFLKSRNITLPMGTVEDTPDMETICGLGNRKNVDFQEILQKEGPEVYPTSVELIDQIKAQGLRVGVATSSRNCDLVLELAGLTGIFETQVDGVSSAEMGLKGKPDPDIFVTAAENLGLKPGECMVVEDAISGVQAGCRGNFGLVLGVARNVEGPLLKRFGADIVVTDLGEITVEDMEAWFDQGMDQDNWRLTYNGLDPGDEKLRETLTTVGNGYMGVRGAFEGEQSSFHFYPGTYLAGVFNSIPSEVQDRTIYNNDFVNCPNWTLIEFKIDNSEFMSPLAMELLSYRHCLDLREAFMSRAIMCRDKLGRITRIRSKRIASMAAPHLCAIQFEVTPCNYTGKITLRSSIDGNIINDGVARYRQLNQQHLAFKAGGGSDQGVYLHVETTHSRYQVVMHAKNVLRMPGDGIQPKRRIYLEKAKVCEELCFSAEENVTYVLEKLTAITTSLDTEHDDPVAAGTAILDEAKSFQGIFGPHKRAWEGLWDKADMAIEGDRFMQRTARLHIYHLLVTASPHNTGIDAGMPARGLHGEAYRGHIFWDELYIFNFFDTRFPEITKALLKYRFNRLDGARRYARENGHQGAMYPWQTADTGDEETQEVHYNPESKKWGPDLSRRQRHVSIAVFYNTWRYVRCSGDTTFLKEYGAELMLEIARFWASIAEFDEGDGRYHIEGVMGPDEFHEKLPDSDKHGLRDNAYTNVMVVWLLEKALELVESFSPADLERFKDKIDFDKAECERWQEIDDKLNVIIGDDGVISQFDGYMALQELDWDHYREKYYSIHRMDRLLKAEGDSPDNYKVAKQADTLMMFYVLPPDEVLRILNKLGYYLDMSGVDLARVNYEYYEPRTSHGSTLSKVVHAVISSFLPGADESWDWFVEAMESDIHDTQGGTTIEGIHTGVMAGTLDVIVRRFAGIEFLDGKVNIHPSLPEHWTELRLKLKHRRVWYSFVIERDKVRVAAEGRSKKPVRLITPGKILDLPLGQEVEVALD
ncbi:MAG: beta-phosphoglucomutase family hydrolase [Desulfovibrio sp.]|nr:MAG: beta-phosphoglucomutase family hydrolase [Desulfovibrio sp.]